MNLPNVVTELINAQNNFDSLAYANCFSETGVMHDEGKSHTGRVAIKALIDETNRKYQSIMKPVAYTETDNSGVLSAEVSGTFEGSPLVLKFCFEINAGLIQYLKVEG